MPQRRAVRPRGRIELVLAEFRSFAHCLLYPTSTTRASAHPGGGLEYLSCPKYPLARTHPERVTELFCLARLLTPNVAFFTYRGIRHWKTLRSSLHLRLLVTMGVLRHMATEGMALVDGQRHGTRKGDCPGVYAMQRYMYCTVQ